MVNVLIPLMIQGSLNRTAMVPWLLVRVLIPLMIQGSLNFAQTPPVAVVVGLNPFDDSGQFE